MVTNKARAGIDFITAGIALYNAHSTPDLQFLSLHEEPLGLHYFQSARFLFSFSPLRLLLDMLTIVSSVNGPAVTLE